MPDVIAALKGVKKIYDEARPVVENLNLEIYRGELLTLLGPSGSGKTSICGAPIALARARSPCGGASIGPNFPLSRLELRLMCPARVSLVRIGLLGRAQFRRRVCGQ